MASVPTINARVLIGVLRRLGFVQVRVRGSHHRFEHRDGRKTTVPVHKGRDTPRGLLNQIVTVDVRLTMEQFVDLL